MVHREFEIKGKRVQFDAFSREPLEIAVKDYPPEKWEYLGSSESIWINGIFQNMEDECHFFRLKNKPAQYGYSCGEYL